MAKYIAKKIPYFDWEKETLGGTRYQGGFYKSGQDKLSIPEPIKGHLTRMQAIIFSVLWRY